MAQIIQIKRGLRANLPTLLAGELAICTDSKEVYAGDGSANILVGRAMSGLLSSRPAYGVQGRFFYVTSGESVGSLYLDTGTAWAKVNVTDLDEVSDGSTYGRVKKTELNNGTVKQLNDGTNAVTASEAKTHINDASKHRIINDTATSSTALWSSSKINSEIYNAIRGLEWQDSVKNRNTTTPPTTNTKGDRYIVPASATGAWSGKTNQIAHWNGSAWEFYTPEVGWSVYVDDENKNYVFNSTNWVKSGEANQTVNAGAGLTGGGSSDSITINVGAGNGITVAADAVAVKAGAGIKVDSNGVGVKAGGGIDIDGNNNVRVKAGPGMRIDGGLGYLEVIGGAGLAVNDQGIHVNAGKGIFVSASDVSANIDSSSIKFDASDRMYVASVDGGTF